MSVTAETPWRSLGPVSFGTWTDVIKSAGGPIDLQSRNAYNAAGDLSGLALAMLAQESSYATRFNRNKSENLNPLNLRPPDGSPRRPL